MSTKKNVEFKLNPDFKSSEEGVLPILPTFQKPGINRKRLRIAITSVAGSVMAVALAFILLMQGNVLPIAAAMPPDVTPEPVTVAVNGIDGLDGKDGVDGKNGYNGKSGKNGANGMSAYEIAVKNGFTGSEQEWITQTTTKIEYATAKTDELQKQIDDNKALIDEAIKNGNADLAKELEEKNKDLQNQLDKSLAELKALLDKLNSRTDGLESSINYINSTNIDIQRQITINKQLLEESIKNGNTDLQKELEAKNAELQAQLDKNLAELQALLDKLGTRTDSLEDSVAVINSKNAEIKQEIDENKALIDKAIADGNAELQKELEEKNSSLQEKFNANLSELQAENELLKGEVSALQTRIKSMEDENRTVTIDPATKHWIVGGVDTGVVAEGINGRDG